MIFSRFKNHKSKDKMGYLDSENFVDSEWYFHLHFR